MGGGGREEGEEQHCECGRGSEEVLRIVVKEVCIALAFCAWWIGGGLWHGDGEGDGLGVVGADAGCKMRDAGWGRA